ncbi:hypothetical protein AC579_7907 [Pseudocercospora musae]|uniref:Uncharacterized protein n=1 Tax=Pseudocercospora musae TaxID=113226 RepID=A0A139IEN4_9PEZI|nr:hypothetical protein AC579_7907 [Pseudocercospora musae]
MVGIFKRIYDWLLSLFWATEMDITMIGLQNAGKTSLLRVLAGGEFTIDSIPTVGFNMKRVQKGHVTLKWYVVGLFQCHAVGQTEVDVCILFELLIVPQLGPGWSASVPINVGAILSRSECDRVRLLVHLGCGTWLMPATRFIVDSADKEALPVAKEELHILLEKPAMEGIPLLVLGNKSDLANHASVDELIDALNLKSVAHREVSCYGISAKEETNLDAVLQWLIARAKN